jgi:hypothetical protein
VQLGLMARDRTVICVDPCPPPNFIYVSYNEIRRFRGYSVRSLFSVGKQAALTENSSANRLKWFSPAALAGYLEKVKRAEKYLTY